MPTYTKSLPQADGWAHAYGYAMDQKLGASQSASEYAIRSAGSDGTFDGTTYTQGAISHFDCDLVYANGAFVTYPEK